MTQHFVARDAENGTIVANRVTVASPRDVAEHMIAIVVTFMMRLPSAVKRSVAF